MSRDAVVMPNADDLRGLDACLQTRAYGRVHEHHAELGSTNDRAAAWLRDGGPHGLVVTADAQTEGRGRNGRAWVSPAGRNLCVSLGLRISSPGAHLAAMGLVVGVGLRRALADVAELRLKWPNDLLVGGKKIAGVLCESRWTSGAAEVVVGFGLNVHADGVDPQVREVATTLELARGAPQRRPVVLAELLLGLEGVLEPFFGRGFAGFKDEYVAHNAQIGARVRVEEPSGSFYGRAEGVADDGALLVRAEGGGLRQVHAADVVSVRPGELSSG